MSWQAIARNDLRQAAHKRETWGLLAGFFIGIGGLPVLLIRLEATEFDVFLNLLTPGVGLLVPLAGIVLGYETVIGERESGAAVLSLSLPHSRVDLIIGKLIGRTLLLAGIVTTAAFAAGLVLLGFFSSFSLVRYGGFTLLTILYGGTYLWIATTLSIAISTSRRVIVAAFCVYLGFTLFWDISISLLETILFRFRPTTGEPETWVTFLVFAGPNTAFNYVVGEVFHAGTVPATVADTSTNFVTPVIALLLLTAWAVAPVIYGYYRFRGQDL